VTFAEAQAHLGMATQHRWSATALARMTPVLPSWSVLMTLLAAPLLERQGETVPQTSWYAKPLPTFSDDLALGRGVLDYGMYDRSQTDFERLLNIGEQVIRIFYAGGIAHQAITNPQPLAFLRRKFVVRHQRRLFH
jgi:hypothetical protein